MHHPMNVAASSMSSSRETRYPDPIAGQATREGPQGGPSDPPGQQQAYYLVIQRDQISQTRSCPGLT